MSSIGEALRTQLLTYTGVSAIIGQRMYPDLLPVNATIPAVLYYCTFTSREHYLGGLSKFAEATFTIECYATSRSGCSQISSAIRNSGIDSFRGVVSGHTFCGVEFSSTDVYRYDQPTDGSRPFRYVVSLDIIISYKEP